MSKLKKFLRFAGQEGDSQEAANPSTEPQTGGGGFRVIRRIATGQYNLPAVFVTRNVEDLDREVGPRFFMRPLSLNGRRSPISMRQTQKFPNLACVRSSLAAQGGVQYKTPWSCEQTTRCGLNLACRKALKVLPQPTWDAPNTEQPDLIVKWREGAHSSLQPAAIAASLAMFAILGCLTRLSLLRLVTYDGMSVYPEIIVQAVGCAVMGMVVKNKVMLES
jgi:hypothetical protein